VLVWMPCPEEKNTCRQVGSLTAGFSSTGALQVAPWSVLVMYRRCRLFGSSAALLPDAPDQKLMPGRGE
jgi:hypothetical protein